MSDIESDAEILAVDLDTDVEDTDDGGAIVRIGEEEEEAQVKDFYANIAEDFPEHELHKLSSTLFQDIERDKKSREKRDKQYEEAIKRTGLGKEAPGGADFEGASKAVHPMLTEGCVDFSARAIKELMPSNGPVKVFVPGDNPAIERLDKAERKKEYMNWQFLIQMPDFRTELEQLLTQLPLGGSQYMRLVWDPRKKRPVPTFWPIDDVFLPFAASNFYTADRVTTREWITSFEFDQRVKGGMYRDIGPQPTGSMPEESKAQQATDKIEGRDDSYQFSNEDGLRAVFDVMVWCELEKDEYDIAPYRVTIDDASKKIVAINRNWEEEDEAKEPMYWMIEFPFVPWRGAYSIGLGQMIGSLSGAATGALRALLDSAHINNIPTLLRLKGANVSGQSKELNVAEVTEIEGGIAGDDIRKLLMAVPYNPPSTVLLSLLGMVVDAGKGMIGTTFESFSQPAQPNMPVGTALAMIEEGMQVLSAIHLRLYQAMNKVLLVLHRIDRMYIDDEEVKNDIGEVLARQGDFELPLDVVPVADPNVFSDVQRMAQLQVISDRAQQMPEIYNLRKVEERILERTKIPNPEELLMPIEEPEQQNAVNENAAMTLQRPVAAFPQQDHLAHLQVHIDYMMSPILGSMPIIAPQFFPMVLEHIKEHLALWYVNENYELLQASLGKSEVQMKQIMQFSDAETRQELDRTLAAISQKVVPKAGEILQQIPDVINQAMQLMSSMQPSQQPPIDPNAQALVEQRREAEGMKDAREREKVQLKLVDDQEQRAAEMQKHRETTQFKFMELSSEERQTELDRAQEDAQKANEYAARLEELSIKEGAEDGRTAAEIASKEEMNAEDNLTALRIAAAEIRSGEKVGVETGTGIDPSG